VLGGVTVATPIHYFVIDLETLGIVRPRAHRALDDARAAGAVLRALTGRWTWAS
jgi:hypothetical protein